MKSFLMLALAMIGLDACSQHADNATVHGTTDTLGSTTAATTTPARVAAPADDSDSDDLPVNAFFRMWDPGRSDESHPHTRFIARAYPPNEKHLLLTLDTLAGPRAVWREGPYGRVDSVPYPRLRTDEVFTNYCVAPGGAPGGVVGGAYTSTTPAKWEHPRLAWKFDTVAKRIVPIPAESITCVLSEPD